MSGSNIFFSGKWKSQTFTANGTFIVPDEVDLVFVEIWGGGGSGGLNPSIATDTAIGGFAAKNYVGPVSVTAGGSISVTIGAGGLGVTASGDGNDGADSQFSYVYGRGGTGGHLVIGSITNLGEDSFRADGGASIPNFSGGDAGYGNGGDGEGLTDGGDGGYGAGGGGAKAFNTSGDGGDGICIVRWKES